MEAKLLSSATIGKTHGLDGYLRIYSLSGEYSHLRKLDSCIVELPNGEELSLAIDSIRTQGELFLFHFSGYDSPEKARKLSKGVIKIPREKAPKLKRGEYYIADLYGMDVLSNGEIAGKVVSTSEGSQALLLEIERNDGKHFLVPLMPNFISNVNVSGNTMELLMSELLA